MAKKQEQTTQAQPEQVSQVEAAAQGREQQEPQGQQTPTYRYNENMINWEELGKFGISKEMLEQSGQLDSMLKGYKTNRTMPLTLNIPGVLTAKLDARLSFISNGGQVMLGIHGIRKNPNWIVLISDISSRKRTRRTCVKVETWDAWLTLTCVATRLSYV